MDNLHSFTCIQFILYSYIPKSGDCLQHSSTKDLDWILLFSYTFCINIPSISKRRNLQDAPPIMCFSSCLKPDWYLYPFRHICHSDLLSDLCCNVFNVWANQEGEGVGIRKQVQSQSFLVHRVVRHRARFIYFILDLQQLVFFIRRYSPDSWYQPISIDYFYLTFRW